MRAVCSAEPRFVDSTAMTASQRTDGTHTLTTRLADEFKPHSSSTFRFRDLTYLVTAILAATAEAGRSSTGRWDGVISDGNTAAGRDARSLSCPADSGRNSKS